MQKNVVREEISPKQTRQGRAHVISKINQFLAENSQRNGANMEHVGFHS